VRKYSSVGAAVSEVLLPNETVDLTRWAVVACDQYTSQPEYWSDVAALVGDAPSTLRLIYPEVYLGEKSPEKRIEGIRYAMREYLGKGLFTPHEGLVYVEREVAGTVRKGVLMCIDLDQYDYRKGSTSLIRATEGTILERIPPRVKIREGAPLELPHIMVLIDDPDDLVIGPLTKSRNRLQVLYDFDLMMDSGHLKGYAVRDAALEEGVMGALGRLADPAAFSKKYGLSKDAPVLLFAMGDGNHSLATAKALWEKTKESVPADSPARYALVEIVNLHDAALVFEPIHRVVFQIREDRDLPGEMESHFGNRYRFEKAPSFKAMKTEVHSREPGVHRFGVIAPEGFGFVEVTGPDSNLPVGTLQHFLDEFKGSGGAKEIDYIHGEEPLTDLGKKKNNIGFYLPAMNKSDLFKTVILDGALPRKTFSMGEAKEKRFYMECRRIR
jgi:hypothetical protein